jgi:hypothetical protein
MSMKFRLEAHQRAKTLPVAKFASFPQLFSAAFVALAPNVNVTYR